MSQDVSRSGTRRCYAAMFQCHENNFPTLSELAMLTSTSIISKLVVCWSLVIETPILEPGFEETYTFTLLHKGKEES